MLSSKYSGELFKNILVLYKWLSHKKNFVLNYLNLMIRHVFIKQEILFMRMPIIKYINEISDIFKMHSGAAEAIILFFRLIKIIL